MSRPAVNSFGRALIASTNWSAPLRWCGPALCMALLWWLSSRQPAPAERNVVRSLLHNSAHFAAYAGLAGSFWLALSRAPHQASSPWLTTRAWLFATAYGIVDEVHQSFVPGRASSVIDLATDAIGAAFAMVVVNMCMGVGPWGLRSAVLLAVAGAGSASLATLVG